MSLDMSKIKRIALMASKFEKMHNLMFLRVYKSDRKKLSKLNICGDLDYLPEGLRFFSWEEYPLPYVPLHLCAENLIRLDMRNSNIRQFGNGDEHFPNLKEINLSHSKYLTDLPDLSHTPKIEWMGLKGCVNLAQIHSSIVLDKGLRLSLADSGPVQIKIGGSIKGRSSSRFVNVYYYLDLKKSLFHKVTQKFFLHGEIISGVRLKHVVMPLDEIEELRFGVQSLASSLPFVRRVDCSEHPTVQSRDYLKELMAFLFKLSVVVGPLRREVINDNEEEDDESIMEYRGGNNSTTLLLIRLPKSITRWSLLKELRLNASDIFIGNASTSNAHEASILKGVKPHLDVKLSLLGIPPSFASHRLLDISSNFYNCFFVGSPNPLFGYELYARFPYSSYGSIMHPRNSYSEASLKIYTFEL